MGAQLCRVLRECRGFLAGSTCAILRQLVTDADSRATFIVSGFVIVRAPLQSFIGVIGRFCLAYKFFFNELYLQRPWPASIATDYANVSEQGFGRFVPYPLPVKERSTSP